MRLRPATPHDLDLVRHWSERPHVVAAIGDDWDWESELAQQAPWREQLIAEVEGRPIGFVQILDPALEESHYWGDCPSDLRAIDIWIGDEADLGRGLGTRMMQLALERCFADTAVEGILVDPLADNYRAHRFYERLGFRFLERRILGDDDSAVYRLDRGRWRRTEGGIRVLETGRLRLRPWCDEDLVPFAEINADERVARYLPSRLTREESDLLAERIRAGFDRDGFGLWAAERRDDPSRPFIGFIGLAVATIAAPFTPCVEIGWRLAPAHWGLGLATEGARAVLRYAFEEPPSGRAPAAPARALPAPQGRVEP